MHLVAAEPDRDRAARAQRADALAVGLHVNVAESALLVTVSCSSAPITSGRLSRWCRAMNDSTKQRTRQETVGPPAARL